MATCVAVLEDAEAADRAWRARKILVRSFMITAWAGEMISFDL